jgi:hypothetical protein
MSNTPEMEQAEEKKDIWDYPYTTDYDSVCCPYCEVANRMEAEDMPWEENGEYNTECYSRGKRFTVLLRFIEHTWVSLPEEFGKEEGE